MRCVSPQYRWIDGEKVWYNCGRCPACLVNRRNEKALRAYMESRTHQDNCYITLTYNDENLPKNSKGVPTLRKAELDNFIKRVRLYHNGNLSVLASGEYSPYPAFRPHYHLCFFGVSQDFFISHSEHYHKNSGGIVSEDCKLWTNMKKEIKGGIEIAPFSFQTASYVAKYITKKTDKPDYEFFNIEPEFVYQSRRPALGKLYAILHRDQLLADGFIRINGHKMPIPRYIVNTVLDKTTDEVCDMKLRLSEFQNNRQRQFNNELSRIYAGSSKSYNEQVKEVLSQIETNLKGEKN